jgi:Kef-type K+ transport system membrane component KefB
MEVLIALLLLLSFSILLGKILEKFGMADIIGQIIAGIILGPTVLNLVTISSTLQGIAQVSIFFILLFIGIELTTEVLTKHLRSAAYFTLSSFIIPVAVMIVTSMLLFHLNMTTSIITAIAIGVPSISIISVLVYKYSIINTKDGIQLLSAVIFTDLIAFIILAAALQISYLPITIIGITVFLIALLYIDKELKLHGKKIKLIFNKLLKIKAEDSIFAIIILVSLLVSTILQLIGITYVLGALFAGMLICKTTVGSKTMKILQNSFKPLNNSFFIPIFFSIAGLEFSLPQTKYLMLLAILIIIVIFVGGILNYMIAKKRLYKIKPKDAAGILGSRGAVGIIIGTIAFQSGIISSNIYAIIILGTIILSIIMPLLLSKNLTKKQNELQVNILK